MTVDEIATQALSLDVPAERAAFLDQACGDDQEIRRKVDSLLAALESVEDASFLGTGLFSDKRSTPSDAPTTTTSEEAAGRFELRSQHAIGGLGEVWVAWDRQLRREVALKQIRSEWSGNFDAVARFRREAEITGFLEHPGVVPIYSLGDQRDGRPFYAMQFIRGRTLEQVITEHLGEPTSPPNVSDSERSTPWYDSATLRKMLDHFVDVCQTIDYAHSKQVVHRDLKPANIMLGTYGQTLVVDWGLAKRLDAAARTDEFGTVEEDIDEQLDVTLSLIGDNDSSVDETRQGTTLGTPRFMSPEQAGGKIDEIGPAADVYCLGATLYFVLTGQAPHTGESDLKSTFNRIVNGRFDPPASVRSEIPGPLQAIVLKAMATEKGDRYASAGKFADDVQRFLADQPVSVFADPPIEGILRWTRNHRALSAAMAVGILLTFIGSITGLVVRQEMSRREMESSRITAEKEREIQFQEQTRRLEALSAANEAMQRGEAAVRESRFADAAAIFAVAIDRIDGRDSSTEQRESLIKKRQRLASLGRFNALHRAGEDLDHLARDTEAAVLLQASLDELGVWDSDTWWDDLPDDDLSAVQRDRLRWQVYRILTALNSLYVTKMIVAMGGESGGGTPSTLKLIGSYLSTNIGKREAAASVELTHRIQSFRPGEAARWLGSIAAFRLDGSQRVEPIELGPPTNPPDGQSLAIFSLIASVDENYRSWFKNYGDTFLENTEQDPSNRALSVALETLRRVSDRAPDDYWIRLTLAQTYYLIAQNAEANGDYQSAIEHYELARSEYGRCIAIRSDAAFGFADRSTVALRQARLMRDSPGATAVQRQKAQALLRTSLRDASVAKRLEPTSHWVYWHVGATSAELGWIDTATDAFFQAVELGFNLQDNLDAPIVRLDDLRGRAYAIEFAYRDAESIRATKGFDPLTSRKASLIASLEYSRGEWDAARTWSEKALELDPDNSRGHQIAGWCALRDQLWIDARNHFSSAIRVSPTDVVSLVGAARVAELSDENSNRQDLEQSDRWYQQAIGAAVSQRHRSTAWFGLAKHELRRGNLDKALAAIKSARTLDPACDVSQFLDLSLSEARRLLILAKSAKSESDKEPLIDRVKELKVFVDHIASLPIASVKQIVDAASDRPSRNLALLGADFELPLETYWTLESIDITGGVTDQALAGSPPLAVSDQASYSGDACLMIRRAEPERPTNPWRLTQTVPAAAGQTYRVSVMVQSANASRETATLVVVRAENELARNELARNELARNELARNELARLELSGESNAWTRRAVEITIADNESQMVPVEIQIRISDPQSGTVLLDDIRVRHR